MHHNPKVSGGKPCSVGLCIQCPLLEVDFYVKVEHHQDLFQKLADDPMDIEEQHAKKRPVQDPETEIGPGCKCSKIGCMKLYCECFSRGIMCGKHCSCLGCQNCKGNEKRILVAQQMANFRKPNSFAGVASFVPIKKCTCKKSHCQKKYCECHSSGIRCGPSCECVDCHNRQTSQERPVPLRMSIPVKG